MDPDEDAAGRRDRSVQPPDPASRVDGPSVIRGLANRLRDNGDSWSASADGLVDNSTPVPFIDNPANADNPEITAVEVNTDGWPVDGWPSDVLATGPVTVIEPEPQARRGPVVLKPEAAPVVETHPAVAAPMVVEAPVVEPPPDVRVAGTQAVPLRRSRRRRRPRVRKVTRVLRRIDPWTVFKISLVLYAVMYVVLMIAGVLLWNLAKTTGTIDNVESFVKEILALKTFELEGPKLLRAARTLGMLFVLAGTGLHVTMAIMFNLISDLVGGLRLTVLEEEVVLRDSK